MENTNWLKQTSDKPLFEDILWLKPENPHQRPKVLLIGGSTHGFAEITKLYQLVKSKSAYQTRVILPKSLEKILGSAIPDTIFVDATSSGEIAQTAKNEIRAAYDWAEVVIFCGDIGNNSQTEILVTDLLGIFSKPTYFLSHSLGLIQKSIDKAALNPNLIFVSDFATMSKLVTNSALSTPLLNADGIVKLVEKLQTTSQSWQATLVFEAESQVIIASGGVVATTKIADQDWQANFTSNSVQFGKIFDSKKFEALVTGASLLA